VASYITAVNDLIVSRAAQLPNAVLYGENIDNGSRISGLSRNLKTPPGGRIINVGDCEATHCGVGFGMLLNGGCAVLFCKQLDFLLLGLDHFVSTYNVIRCHKYPKSLGSFTIITIVCDQGLQGPQSSFNALGDICSLARVEGYTITNDQDAAHVLNSQVGKTGFRFIALSQALFPTEFLRLDLVYAAPDSSLFQYTEGDEATIVCFNFSLAKGHVLQQKLSARGMRSSLFSLNYAVHQNWERIRQSVQRTGKVIVIDDSKSVHLPGYRLLYEIGDSCPQARKIAISRGSDVDFGVSPDALQIDYDAIVSQLCAPGSSFATISRDSW